MSITQNPNPPQDTIEPFGMKIPEACRMLCCSTSTVHRLLVSGKLVAVKRGTSTLVTVSSIRAYEASLPRATFGVERDAMPPSAA